MIKIRHFSVVVAPWRLRNVQRSVMHVQGPFRVDVLLIHPGQLLFWRSSSRRRRKSLLLLIRLQLKHDIQLISIYYLDLHVPVLGKMSFVCVGSPVDTALHSQGSQHQIPQWRLVLWPQCGTHSEPWLHTCKEETLFKDCSRQDEYTSVYWFVDGTWSFCSLWTRRLGCKSSQR